MAVRLIRFLNIVMAGLITGTIFGIWIGYNPAGWSATTYIEQQQSAINALNTLMPVLGLVTIALTLISAFQQKRDKSCFYTLLLAAAVFLVSGLTTRFGNQPINSIVMTWDINAAPEDWMVLRDKWWSYHIIRTAAAFISFCLIVWTNTRRQGA